MKTLHLAAVCLAFASAAMGTSFAQEYVYREGVLGRDQTWKVPGSLARAIAQATPYFQNYSIVGDASFDLIDELSSECTARVFRPKSVTDVVKSDSNDLSCTVVDGAGKVATVHIDIGDVPFETWGNRPESDYNRANGRNEPFQVLNHGINESLYLALRALAEKKHPLIHDLMACDNVNEPEFKLCTNTYFLVSETNTSAPYLSCTFNTEGQSVYQTRCVFHFPEQ
jgi:hypothetical protein